MILQSLLQTAVKLAQYGQGVGLGAKMDRTVLQQLRAGSQPLVIFDVGANRGAFTDLALHELSHHPLTIHAFEPSRAAFSELAKRFAGNPNVILNNIALGSEVGDRTLFSDQPGSELSSLYARKIAHHGIHFEQSETVTVNTLDRYGLQPIDLLKLDVEGHELAVLQGAAELFARKQIAMVSFEFGGCNLDSRTFLRDFFEFFSASGMTVFRVAAFGGVQRLPRYEEAFEQFRTTCFLARYRG